MNSLNDFQKPAKPQSPGTVVLTIRGVGHIPSFKNAKRAILDKNTGRMRTLTQGKIKKRMDALEDAIVFALFSWFQTSGDATQRACWKPSLTHSFGPSDDSILEIPCGEWDVRYVAPGEEGVEITIQEIL